MNDTIEFIKLRQTGKIDNKRYVSLEDKFLKEYLSTVRAYSFDTLNEIMRHIYILLARMDVFYVAKNGDKYYSIKDGETEEISKNEYDEFQNKVKQERY